MLKLLFEGYYQMRMSTDPDPPDDPRGLSGYTFALPGEPDFDRVRNGWCVRAISMPHFRLSGMPKSPSMLRQTE